MHFLSNRTRPFSLLIEVFLLLTISVCGCFKTKYEEIPPDLPSMAGLTLVDSANFNWTYSTLDGETNPFSQHKGNVIFLNFWATWCGPCKAEMPKIQSLYDKMQNSGIDFFLISNEKADILNSFLRANNYELPVYKADQNVFEKFKVEAIPTTFIIDKKGRTIFKHVGAAKWDDDSVIRFLTDLRDK